MTVQRLPLPFLLAACLLLTACGREQATESADGQRLVATIPVSTHVVERVDVPLWLESVGRVKSLVAPVLAAEVSGRVVTIEVDAGDRVSKGQLLISIDTTTVQLEMKSAQADIQRLQALIANEKVRLRRLQKLSSDNLVSESQLDDTLANVDVFQAELESARARLAIVNDNLSKARVASPVDGDVQQRFVSEGDFVERGDPLFEIAECSRLQAWLPFPETLAERIYRGQKVILNSPAAPSQTVEGEITELQPNIGSGSRAVVVIVDFDNPGSWKPEATVTAEVLVGTRAGALVTPRLSVVRRPSGNVVYVIDGDAVRARSVEVAERVDEYVVITAGLSGGERVVTDGAAFLTDGARIRVVESGR